MHNRVFFFTKFSSLQTLLHLVLTMADELLLDCFDAWQVNVFEHGRDNLLEELLTFHKVVLVWILDTAQTSGVVDLHFVRRILVGPHAVNNHIDIQVTFVVLGNLDIRFDILSHGKVIGCDLIELFNELNSTSFCHFFLVDSDLERLSVVQSRICFDCG